MSEELYKEIVEHYLDPTSWRRFPIEGVDANGSPTVDYFWVGDGGAFAMDKILKSVGVLSSLKRASVPAYSSQTLERRLDTHSLDQEVDPSP